MKERPILMSTPMVQAILEGRKTMTRRIIKSFGRYEVKEELWEDEFRGENIEPLMIDKYGPFKGSCCSLIDNNHHCPFGYKGDLIWVRESGWVDNNYIPGLNDPHLFWKADYDNYDEHTRVLIKNHTCRFPGIHMYKVFARIWLEIIAIKVERLQDISPGDACDEGVEYWNIDRDAFEGGELVADFKNYTWKDDEKYKYYDFPTYANPVDSYRSLWELINNEESWNANPFVWVIEFKRIKK